MTLVTRISAVGCATAGRTFLIPLLLTLGTALDAHAAPYTPPASNRASIALSGSWRFLKADGVGAEAPGFDDSRCWP
jgi:hypothetical protein